MPRLWIVAAMMLWLALPAAGAEPANVAVFNFQMKSDTPEWVWLEKGLADQITTDFVQGQRLTVVARDEMQLLARRLRWAPEMALGDPAAMDMVRRQLRIERLVTGIYSVKDGQVEIVAQVVDVETRRELARRDVRGPAGDVLALQRKLSAELLAWFTRERAEAILPQLPVWTRSVPAARTLYEGMGLYDEGRYQEAWLKFRQAGRADPSYLEAHYWVGRMYYFMARYEHARRAYEGFLYGAAGHPRAGDAVKEYVHTYENAAADLDSLLALYESMGRRFPMAVVHNEVRNGTVPAKVWVRARAAQVLARAGLYESSAAATGDAALAMEDEGGFQKESLWRIAMQSCLSRYHLAGRTYFPAILAKYSPERTYPPVRFRPGQTSQTVRFRRANEFCAHGGEDGATYHWHPVATMLQAPEGYVFTKITITPSIRGAAGTFECNLFLDGYMDVSFLGGRPLPAEAANPWVFDRIHGGIFNLVFSIHQGILKEDAGITMSGYRVDVEMQPVPDAGAIRLTATNTEDFLVVLDGRKVRRRSGLIGPVPAGRHVLNLVPRMGASNYANVQVPVDVKAGQTADVTVTLPWAPESPWRTWTPGVRIGREYPSFSPCTQEYRSPPAVFADAGAIRVFWSYQGDLWWALSADGATFSRPAKLPMPVSSGWIEKSPLCFRDESGRFVLAFLSDREGQHQMRPYACWSRDGVHWSNPSMIVDRPVNYFHFAQAPDGRYLWADATNRTMTILESNDAYHWRTLSCWPMQGEEHGVNLVAGEDGRYDLLAVEDTTIQGGAGEAGGDYTVKALTVRRSGDARVWGRPQTLYQFQNPSVVVSAFREHGRTVVGVVSEIWYAAQKPFTVLLRERADGTFETSPEQWEIGSSYGVVTRHPRWGYLVCWHYPPQAYSSYDAFPVSGPFLIRGPSLDPFFVKETPASRPAATNREGHK